MLSRATVSRDLGVYLTARSAMFMRGETEVIVPFTIVPTKVSDSELYCWAKEHPRNEEMRSRNLVITTRKEAET